VAEKEGEGYLRVVEAGEGRGSVSLRLRHMVETTYACHVLQISCTLWVYNCAGLPIALQQSTDEDERGDTVSRCCWPAQALFSRSSPRVFRLEA